ncbi:MAG: T9SS type A sorting domain-containing protein [Vicingaceae bacterium]|nr:T9SS type A sorting domain-containing protein [Vicingaceae bacterium]
MKKTLLFLTIFQFCITPLQSQVLISNYSFNDGTSNDQVGDINGANNGATLTEDRFGNANMAMYFDGSATIDYGDSSETDLNNITGISISCWTKSNNLSSSGLTSIVSRWTGSSSSEQYGLFAQTNDHVFAIGSVASNGVSLNGNIDTAWTHLVVTYSGTSVIYYINGVSSGGGFTANPFPGSSGSAKLFVGSQNGTSRFFTGAIDDIKIYDEIISAATVLALYNESNPTVGVNENPKPNQITLYPNPSSSTLNINSSDAVEQIRLIDLTGKTIETIIKPNNTIDISLLSKGVYLLQIQSEKGISHKRFIKE